MVVIARCQSEERSEDHHVFKFAAYGGGLLAFYGEPGEYVVGDDYRFDITVQGASAFDRAQVTLN